MKRDIAERLAATEVPNLSVEDAQKVLARFLAELARCPVCDGSGETTYRYDVSVDVVDEAKRPLTGDLRFIRGGTVTACPLCGSDDPQTRAKGDPSWVAWCCVAADAQERCDDEATRRAATRRNHADCGWRVALPLQGAGAEAGRSGR